jgi:hypothetical protein
LNVTIGGFAPSAVDTDAVTASPSRVSRSNRVRLRRIFCIFLSLRFIENRGVMAPR